MAQKRGGSSPKGGGKFKTERQRRFLWAAYPKAARKWAHRMKTSKTDWMSGRPARKR